MTRRQRFLAFLVTVWPVSKLYGALRDADLAARQSVLHEALGESQEGL